MNYFQWAERKADLVSMHYADLLLMPRKRMVASGYILEEGGEISEEELKQFMASQMLMDSNLTLKE